MLGHKVSLGKFKKIEITSNIFSDAKNTNRQRQNNMLLSNQGITGEIKEEIIKYLETNENESTNFQNLWDTVKVVLREKFIVIQIFLKKLENSEINNLIYHQKLL